MDEQEKSKQKLDIKRFLTLILHSVKLATHDVVVKGTITYMDIDDKADPSVQSGHPLMTGEIFIPTALLPKEKTWEQMSLLDWRKILVDIFSLKVIIPDTKPIAEDLSLPPGEERIKAQKKAETERYRDYQFVVNSVREQMLANRIHKANKIRQEDEE